MIAGKRDPRAAAVMVIACALWAGGCAEWRGPRIDPTGERLFTTSDPLGDPLKPVPGAPRPWDTVELILVPRSTIAPIGSEVVLLAGVAGPDGYLRTNERIEWSIAPGSVGEFVDFDTGSFWDIFFGTWPRPHKPGGTFVVGSTSRRSLRLTRGTPTPNDDVTVLRGQTWVSLTSPVEGTSYVTAYSPDVFSWERRKQTAVVHWVDAQWRLPPPAINPAGSRHAFTTMVMRQSDQSPCVGWRVQYSIADGPPAGFAPSGAATVEVETNAQGQATAEIAQQQPASGTNRIAIQIIRPAKVGDPAGTRLVVGSGFTSATWTAPGLAVRKTGPAAAAVGATLLYRIEVSNSGDMPSEGVTLTDEVPDETSYLSSNPPGQLTGRRVQWQIGRLGPAERRTIEVQLRAERQGNITTCAEATAANGLRARDCATTSISLAVPPGVAPGGSCVGPTTAAAPLEVRITGPDRAYVGDVIRFQIQITNRGATTATGIVVKDRFDPGLAHETLRSPIKKSLNEDLPPGQSREVFVEFRAVLPGRQCQTVEVTGNNGSVARAEHCVTVMERSGGLPPAVPSTPAAPPSTPPGTTAPPTSPGTQPAPKTTGQVTLRVTGPPSASVGQEVDFFVEFANDGAVPLTTLKVLADFDAALEPKGASEAVAGYEGDAVYWTLASLSPGQKKTIQVRCACMKEAVKACLRVKVTAAEAGPAQQETCVTIRAPAAVAPPTGLSMTVSALHEPVAVGKELTYVVQVTNGGKTDESQVELKVLLPDEMIPALLGMHGPTPVNVQGKTVKFQPVERLRPGETLTYRVRVQAKTAGEVRLKAELTSRNQRQPVLAEARTTIVPGR